MLSGCESIHHRGGSCFLGTFPRCRSHIFCMSVCNSTNARCSSTARARMSTPDGAAAAPVESTGAAAGGDDAASDVTVRFELREHTHAHVTTHAFAPTAACLTCPRAHSSHSHHLPPPAPHRNTPQTRALPPKHPFRLPCAFFFFYAAHQSGSAGEKSQEQVRRAEQERPVVAPQGQAGAHLFRQRRPL